jgi:hypothetical protein
MNKNKLFLALAISAIVFVTLACSIDLGTGLAPLPTRYPTQVPQVVQPTVVPPTVLRVDSTGVRNVVTNLGFYDDGFQCSTPCDSYTYDGNGSYVSVLFYKDSGDLLISLAIGVSDNAIEIEAQKMTNVLDTLYTPDITTWVIDHTTATSTNDQTGYVDGYNLTTMSVQADDGEWFFTVYIEP